MALTKEDIQAIAELMATEREHTARLILESEQRTNTRLDGMDKRLDTMQDGIAALNADMSHHNHHVEPLMKSILEKMDGMDHKLEKLDKIDSLEAAFQEQHERIWALEHTKA